MTDEYITIEKEALGEYKEKGSKFLAYAYPVSTIIDVEYFLKGLKSIHPKARHICYAYEIGVDGNTFRANDDGEPSGTAGRPILGQIHSHNMTDVVVFVVRYFGGTKLGAAGLINAYKTSTSEALDEANPITKYINDNFEISFSYENMGVILNELKHLNIEVINKHFNATPSLTVQIRTSKSLDKILQFKARLIGFTPDDLSMKTKVEQCIIKKIEL